MPSRSSIDARPRRAGSPRRLALFALLLVAACAPTGALINRASFDLQCTRDKLKIVELDMNTKGIQGCGRQATYVWMCGQNQSCAWVMNSPNQSTAKP